ncbi:MAG: protein tyrosine kinase [Gordonia sp.]|uniref:polysaccharide biosynthesis tyrosine autokinase n=1 Tax=Gordonia sp. (in: high G+C Gram-positive bacteria) TaxID=84139 RepID=UPI000C491951|nr:polysaccharide biosynthesis tyrosine autokinase [Gordonia sp. (in: high G+C Gram-positive bacteria)]MAU81603.1 protein tyrosine kinase [Gordonia sp. (in: high G+C Gram-positive bacteria)]
MSRNAELAVPGGPDRGFAQQFGGVLRQGWWVIALSALLAAVISTAISLAVTPQFASSATLYVTSGSGSSEASAAYQGSLASQQRVASYVSLAHSDAIITRAIQESGLAMSDTEARDAISASAMPDTVLLEVQAVNKDPRAAAQLANQVADAMVQYVATLEQPADGEPPQARLTVVSAATAPSSPVSPNVRRNVGLALIVGGVAGVLGVIARSRMNTTLSSEDDVARIVGEPILSSIPEDSRLAQAGVVDFMAGGSLAAEAFRRLRTNLAYVLVDRPARKIVVTSSLQDEGKTTVSLNIAASIAEAGDSVVLVGADLRMPSVAERLNITGDVGLTSVLRGDVTIADAIQQTSYPNFDVLPCGEIPPNPAELLATPRMGQCLEELAASYDYVVVDTPPILPVTDPAVVAQWADGVIVAVRLGNAKAPQLNSAMQRLQDVQAPILGLVLNRSRQAAILGSETYYSYGATGTSSESCETLRPGR